MCPKSSLTTMAKTAAATALLLLSFTACQNSPQPVPKPPPVSYSETYDHQIKDVLRLANENHWEEAQAKADALVKQDATNPILARVQSWVQQQAQQHRAQNLERSRPGSPQRCPGRRRSHRKHAVHSRDLRQDRS
jgi:hypothetical protein